MLHKQRILIIADNRFEEKVKEFDSLQYQPDQVNQLKALLQSQSIVDQHHGIIGLRKIISAKLPPINLYIQANLIPRIAEMAKLDQFPQLQFEAIWVLTNIIWKGDLHHAQELDKSNVMEVFVHAIRSNNDYVIDKGLQALAKMSADNIKNRDKVLELALGHINQLLKGCQQSKIYMINGIRVIRNLCRLKPNPPYLHVQQSLAIFISLLPNQSSFNNKIYEKICLTLINYIDSQQIWQALLQENNISKILLGLRQGQLSNLEPALVILNKLLKRQPSALQIFVIIDKSLLAKCKELVSHSRPNIRGHVLMIIYRACKVAKDHNQLILLEQLIPNAQILSNQKQLQHQLLIIKIFTHFIKKDYPCEAIIKLLSSLINEPIIKKIGKLVRLSDIIYQALLYCYKFKQEYAELSIVFTKWVNKWDEYKQRIYTRSQKALQVMLRIKRIIDLANDKMECERSAC